MSVNRFDVMYQKIVKFQKRSRFPDWKEFHHVVTGMFLTCFKTDSSNIQACLQQISVYFYRNKKQRANIGNTTRYGL